MTPDFKPLPNNICTQQIEGIYFIHDFQTIFLMDLQLFLIERATGFATMMVMYKVVLYDIHSGTQNQLLDKYV